MEKEFYQYYRERGMVAFGTEKFNEAKKEFLSLIVKSQGSVLSDDELKNLLDEVKNKTDPVEKVQKKADAAERQLDDMK